MIRFLQTQPRSAHSLVWRKTVHMHRSIVSTCPTLDLQGSEIKAHTPATQQPLIQPCQNSPTSMFHGLRAVSWVFPMFSCCGVLLLLPFRANEKFWPGRKETILEAVCGLLKQRRHAATWAVLWERKAQCCLVQPRSAKCLQVHGPAQSSAKSPAFTGLFFHSR